MWNRIKGDKWTISGFEIGFDRGKGTGCGIGSKKDFETLFMGFSIPTPFVPLQTMLKTDKYVDVESDLK